MTDSDAFGWYMERDPHLRSTVVGIAVLDCVPDWDVVRARVERAVLRLPVFRSHLQHPPLRLATPRWTQVADVDLDWHVRRTALPAPGGWSQLLDIARRKAVTAFDPARPLWEMTLVEGLHGDRAALVIVMHHSISDGIGGVQMAMELFDLERSPAADDRVVPEPAGEDLGGLRLAWDAVEHDAALWLHVLRAAPRAGVTALATTLRSPLGAVGNVVATARSVARLTAPALDTKSPVMRGRRLARSFDLLDVPLADLRRAAAQAGGHLNDAFLGGVTGGLRRYHERHESEVDELRLTLPISLRRPEDPPGGNLITLVRLTVPVGLRDPVARMAVLRQIVDRWRAEPSLRLTQPVAAALNLLPSAVVGAMLKHVDVLASNVPGFPVPIFLGGALVEAYYPFGPTTGAAVNVTLMSYADRCCIGISCDTAAVPDPHVLVDCLREGFEEVLGIGGAHDPVRMPVHDPVPA